jgi:hypothetical protein
MLLRLSTLDMTEDSSSRATKRMGYWLGGALASVSAVAAAATLFVPGILTGPAVMNGSARGTALVVLLVAVPTLLTAMWSTARGSVRALLVWLGTAGYLIYNAIMFAFATPFNRLFLGYMAMLSLSIWTVIVVLYQLDLLAIRHHVLPSMPVRGIAIYVWLVVMLNLVAWLSGIVLGSMVWAFAALAVIGCVPLAIFFRHVTPHRHKEA